LMRLLFVKLKHIGIRCFSPNLAAVKEAYPDAEIWVVVRKSCEASLPDARPLTGSSPPPLRVEPAFAHVMAG